MENLGQKVNVNVLIAEDIIMLTYEEYEAESPLVCNEYEAKGRKERRRRRAFERAARLQEIDLSRYSSRGEAERALEQEGEALVVGSGGILFMILTSIISWMIRKLLDKAFPESQ